MIEAKIMKGEGVTAGVADVLLLVPSGDYHGIAIEFKTEVREFSENGHITTRKTYQRKKQRDWQNAVEQQGYKYIVVRSYEEFWKEMNEYLGRKTALGAI